MDAKEKRKRTHEGIRVAFLLRHNPEKYGLSIDKEGWVSTADLMVACDYTQAFLDELVAYDNKRRYEYNDDKSMIRALQGHSHPDVEMARIPVKPPRLLYHGTTREAGKLIIQTGLNKMDRHHVHMTDVETKAIISAVRWKQGPGTLLRIHAGAMHEAGLKFYCTDNGVWLTEHVPPNYIVDYWPTYC